MPTSYRIEICPNNRAVCKEKVCKDQAIKITKGELRFATWVEIKEHGSWAYKHWGCVSGAQIESLRALCDDGHGGHDFDIIDGYDELGDHPDIQEKIRRCVQQGHIDAEDFKGDPEKNFPGVKGIYLTAKQRGKRDAEKAAEEKTPETEQEPETVTKTPATRGRKRVTAAADEEETAPQPKKAKTARGNKAQAPPGDNVAKRRPKVKKEESEEEEEVKPAPKKTASRRTSKVKAGEASDEAATSAPPVEKPAARRSSKVKAEAEDVEPAQPTKAKRGRKSAVKKEVEEEEDAEVAGVNGMEGGEDVQEEKPVPKKKKKRGSEMKAEAETEEKPKGRRRSGRA